MIPCYFKCAFTFQTQTIDHIHYSTKNFIATLIIGPSFSTTALPCISSDLFESIPLALSKLSSMLMKSLKFRRSWGVATFCEELSESQRGVV